MKRALLPFLLTLPLIHIGGCSSEDAPIQVPGAAGTGAPSTAGSDPTGGTAPSAAGSGTGVSGSSDTGGAPTGTAGAGGSTGGTGEAGSSGSGTSGSGTGGATGGSGTGGAGGAPTGGASTAGSGGMSMGGGGTGTGGGTATPVSVGKLDGALIMTPCGDSNTSDDCAGSGWIYEGKNTPCNGRTLDSDAPATKSILDFPVTGGEKGKHYLAKMHFYGIMEPKNYGNGITREAGTQRPNAAASPSKPEGFAYANGGVTVDTTDYNNYEIHSFDDTGKEIKQYFLNSDTAQGHWTFAIDYERDIEIVAGGKVHLRIYDNNCRMIKNCEGGDGKPPCDDNKVRRIDISAADPQPVGLVQPGLGKDVKDSGQWWLLDVKSIVAKP
jgi:hypothetical protein